MSCENKKLANIFKSVVEEKDVGSVKSISSVNNIISSILQTNTIIQPGEIKEKLKEKIKFNINDRVYAVGKNNYFLDEEVVGPTEEERKKDFNNIIKSQDVEDSLRLAAGKYWVINKNNVFSYFNKEVRNVVNFRNYNVLNNSITIADIPGTSQTDLNFKTRNWFFGTKQWVMVQLDKNFFQTETSEILDILPSSFIEKALQPSTVASSLFSPEQLQKLTGNNQNTGNVKVESRIDTIKNIKTATIVVFDDSLVKHYVKGGLYKDTTFPGIVVENRNFTDHAFVISTPFIKKQVDKFSNLKVKPLYSNINSVYNFLNEEYEKQLPNIVELSIPNFYILFSEIDNNGKPNEKFLNHITLGGALKNNVLPIRSLPILTDIKVEKIKGFYFEKYAEKIKSRRELAKTINDDFYNIGIPISNISILRKYENKKNLVPMYSQLEFSIDPLTQFSNIMNDIRLSTKLISDVSKDIDEELANKKKFVFVEEIVQEYMDDFSNVKIDKKYTSDIKDFKIWNVTNWINDNSQTKNTKVVFLNNESKEQVELDPFVQNLMRIIGVGKIRKLIKDKFRTFQEMIEGKLSYSETVLYRIEKFKSDNNGNKIGTVIQNIYLPNSNEEEIFKFIDTQVKYGQNYLYNVYAYQLVVGTSYNYSNLEILRDLAWFLVTQSPSIQLIEVPYCSMRGSVFDDPPLAPNVDLVSYRGYNSSLLLLFDTSVGKQATQPIIIEPTDEERIKKLIDAKNYEKGEDIIFKTDDSINEFQIFRIDFHPKSYKDFTGKMIASVLTDVSKITPNKASSASYIDDLKPNKKYYYCFRSIDYHNHISNPTPVLQVELIDDHGTTYPIIKEVDFIKNENNVKQKSFRKYLLIKPAFAQTIINENKSGIVDVDTVENIKNVYLGVLDESVWDKDYVIRLKSKKTGRSIDFNVKFSHEHNKKEI